MAAGDRTTISRKEHSGVFDIAYRQTGATGLGTEVAVAHGEGRDIQQVPIAQGAAGATTLVNAVAGKVIYVVSYLFVLSADGTVKFTDGTADLSGAMDISGKGGAAALGRPSSPLFWTNAANRPLTIVTTGGAARGHITYFLE